MGRQQQQQQQKISVLAQIFTKLWSIYELHNYIILIIILKIIIQLIYIINKKTTVYSLDFRKKVHRMMQNNIY